MQGDELIQYGFKRVVEELQDLNTSLNMIGEELRNLSSAVRREAEQVEKIENNTYTSSSMDLENNALLQNISNAAMVTEVVTAEIKRKLYEVQHGNTGQEEI